MGPLEARYVHNRIAPFAVHPTSEDEIGSLVHRNAASAKRGSRKYVARQASKRKRLGIKPSTRSCVEAYRPPIAFPRFLM